MINYPYIPIEGTVYIGTWKTEHTNGCDQCRTTQNNGGCPKNQKIPIYTVLNVNGLNTLVGHVKHINAGNGTVLCRGECHLHPSIRPSILRNNDEDIRTNDIRVLDKLIQKISADRKLMKIWHFYGLAKEWSKYQALAIESTLQHYGARTRCVDFVDNLWIALWFGLNQRNIKDRYNVYEERNSLKSEREKQDENENINLNPECSEGFTTILEDLELGSSSEDFTTTSEDSHPDSWVKFFKMIRGLLPSKDPASPDGSQHKCKQYRDDNEKGHMYLFLYVAETNHTTVRGISFGEHTYVVDLRKALPPSFLRPCAQHGWMVRGKDNHYRFEDHIACVVRISVELAKEILGNGVLTNAATLFPSEEQDDGYHILLQRQKGTGVIVKHNYAKIIPKGTIDLSFMENNRQK